MTALAIIKQVEKACALLAGAKTLDEVLHVHDKARALETYARLREHGSDAHASAWELCKLAERRLGEMTAALPKATAGRKKSVSQETHSPGPRSKGDVLIELGVSRLQAARAEKLAAVPLADFNERLAHAAELVRAGKRVPELTAVTADPEHSSDEYGTPSRYLDAAREVLGPIELDPASNTAAANVVRAERWWHKLDSGLDREWDARNVWMNPPYSAGLIDRFVGHLCDAYAFGKVGQAIALVNCAPSTKWFQRLLESCDGFVLLDHRIAFVLDGKPVRGNRYEQAAFYFGDQADAFFDAWSQFGTPCRTALNPQSAPATRALSTPPELAAQSAAGADVVPTP